jgi:hypothetical protein
MHPLDIGAALDGNPRSRLKYTERTALHIHIILRYADSLSWSGSVRVVDREREHE